MRFLEKDRRLIGVKWHVLRNEYVRLFVILLWFLGMFLRLVFRLLFRLFVRLIYRLFLHLFRNFTVFFWLLILLHRSLSTVPALGITFVVTPAASGIPVQPLGTVHRVLLAGRARNVHRTVPMLYEGNLVRRRIRRALADLLRQADTGLGQGTPVEASDLLGNLP